MLDIAHAPPEDRDEIAGFMENAFPRAKWPRSGWEAILSGRWNSHGDSYAISVRDKGKLIGVLGLVSATRPSESGRAKTVNMTSWYVDKTYRGQGVGSRMLDLVTADPDITVTNFSSAKGAVPVVERAGFSVLDAARCVWRPRARRVPLPLYDAPLELGQSLNDRDRRVILDHAGLDLKTCTVKTPDGFCTMILSVKQKHDAYVTYETMYLGDRALFAQYAREIADSVLPPSAAVLSVDQRFVAGGTQADEIQQFAVPRYYTAGRMAGADVDHLYSEIVLLGLKMY